MFGLGKDDEEAKAEAEAQAAEDQAKADESAAAEGAAAEAEAAASEDAPLPPLVIIYPEYNGKKILEVLPEGHSATETHVRFDDGTTGHVPTEILSK